MNRFLNVLKVTLMLMFISACSQANSNSVAEPEEMLTQKDFITNKVEFYTQDHFRFVEKFTIEGSKAPYTLHFTFVPEVGSAPIKEDIYRSMVDYAWNVNNFFPEIKRYEFQVLWDENVKKEAIKAIMDEEAVRNLIIRYLDLKNAQLGGSGDVSYRSFFSNLTESDEAKRWAEKETGV
ncbi:hypothetical protein [Paenibacillus agri]|uniref:DUF4825 domain-containing protein n=1 Tax=Paenibacillus agri TaxID=2744309 RepID=A0A850EFZ3_9BACL|nr:hypothetical protein [Paenibacillus agri]NUU59336.1 hypothetical protein [Paenibacillus agri]